MVSNRKSNASTYIGAYLNKDIENATIASKKAFEDTLFRAKDFNTNFNQAKGNIFEYFADAKLRISEVEHGNVAMKYATDIPKIRGGVGEHTAIDDIRIPQSNGFYSAQLKVHDDPYLLFKDLQDKRYFGQDIVTTKEGYFEEIDYLNSKLSKGDISKREYDFYRSRLKKEIVDPKTGATSGEISEHDLYKLKGKDGTIDYNKVQKYVNRTRNELFLNECLDLTKKVTITSAITSCVFSTVRNTRDYLNSKIELNEMIKNVSRDTLKGAGRGLVVSTTASGVKYVGFKSNTPFLQNGVTALIVANGAIDIGKAFYLFQRKEISMNEFMANVVVTTFISAISLGVKFILSPMLGLVSTIVIDYIGHSILNRITKNIKDEFYEYNNYLATEIQNDINNKVAQCNQILDNNRRIYNDLQCFFDNALSVNNSDFDLAVSRISNSLNLNLDFVDYNDFKDKINNDEKIVLDFRKK